MMARFVLAALALTTAFSPSLAEERISSFVSDVEVLRNGDLIVTESLDVWAEGRQIRRGILRDFPTVYHRADGSRVEVGFDIQGVMRDGGYETYSTERMTNGVRVRIGNTNGNINQGSQRYVI